MGSVSRYAHHPILSQPAISLSLTALSLLLLVLVLLSVPGPIKGLYWFSVAGEQSGEGDLSAGVLGWCETETSNCTYGPLSDNKYLSSLIDTGEALTVRMMLPLACYWSIVTLAFWIALCISTSFGYKIRDLDSISRHLRFAVVEACVLCVTLFGNVLCWLAFGLGRTAFLTVQDGGGKPKSGHAMETTAVAALMSLLSLCTAIWGLHLRLKAAQAHWKEEAVMVRRRSMALSAAGAMGSQSTGIDNKLVGEKTGSRRWSEAADSYFPSGAPRASMLREAEEEERLDNDIAMAKRNSREQDMMLRRASMISPNDGPYAAAQKP